LLTLLVQLLGHASLGLVSFLQSVEQLGLVQLKLLGFFYAVIPVIQFLFCPPFVVSPYSLLVHITDGGEMRLCTHLRLLYFLELCLPVAQHVQIIAVNHVVYPHLLILYVVVSPSLRLECPAHACH